MQTRIVRRCIRPQCMAIYNETEKNRFCLCGASLQVIEIKIKEKSKNDFYKKAYLYLLLDEEDIEFELSNITRVGRSSDGVRVDVDLSEYAGKDVSREHAVIRKEKAGYYLTNVSRTHSVCVIDLNENKTVLDYGKKILLKPGDGIVLSKKILLQFEEEE